MKWKIKAEPPPPKAGDTRIRVVFAWKPVVVGEYKVWLEHYRVSEKCVMKTVGFGVKEPVWEEVGREAVHYEPMMPR